MMPDMQVAIRQVGAADIATAQQVLRQFHKAALSAAHAASILANPANVLLVAEAEARIKGFLFAHWIDRLPSQAKQLFIYEVEVADRYRRAGIGSALLAKALSTAHGRGARAFVFTNHSNPAAIGLYRRAGGIARKGDDILFVFDDPVAQIAASPFGKAAADASFRSRQPRAASKPDYRAARESDAVAISALVHHALHSATLPGWSPEAVASLLAKGRPDGIREKIRDAAFAHAAVVDDSVVGFILCTNLRFLNLLVVDPAFQCKGIGSHLMKCMLEHLRDAAPELSVVEVNATEYSLPFYGRFGFYPLSEMIESDGCRFIRLGHWLRNPQPSA